MQIAVIDSFPPNYNMQDFDNYPPPVSLQVAVQVPIWRSKHGSETVVKRPPPPSPFIPLVMDIHVIACTVNPVSCK